MSDDIRAMVDALTPGEQRTWLSALLRQRKNAEHGLSDIQAEAVLDPSIRPASAAPERQGPARAVFLTGATGFVGAFLLDELLRTTDATVHCLVRTKDEPSGSARLREALSRYQLGDATSVNGRVVPVVGDLGRRLFGLAPARFDELASTIDVAYHCGAVPNWIYPYDLLRGSNVVGTTEVIRLCARTRRKPLHYLSTIGTVLSAGDFAARVIEEDVDLDTCAGHPIGYVQTKWVAEKLVVAARSRGLSASIYRPPFVSGHSGTGVYKTVGDFVYAYLRSSVRFGVTHERDWLVSIVPVDHVARAVLALAQRPSAAGQNFHFASNRPVRWFTLVSWLRQYGYPIKPLALDTWLAAIQGAGRDNDLHPFLPLLTPREAGTSPYDLGYLRSAVDIRCDNALRELPADEVSRADMTEAIFRKHLDYLVGSGVLPAPSRATA
jgi:myxalamid-type nonribosomal peptide synthetase MxaA